MSELPCKPNFFIVGAPKSGTTSLHHYLSQHPDVFMSVPKEPCFLAPDFFSPTYPQTEAEYYRCFRGYRGEFRVGESTTTYLYSSLAAGEIHRFSPDAKIIAMLRNPVEMIFSLHAQRMKEGNEDIRRLEAAFDAESDRRQGKRIPKGFQYPKEYLLYRDIGMYAKQLRRYFVEFGRDKVHVIIFDDFIQNTESEFNKACEFLGISSDFSPEITVENPGRIPRVLLLHRVLRQTAPLLDAIKIRMEAVIPPRLVRLLGTPYRTLVRLNFKTGRDSIRPETRAALASYYEQEIKDLEVLLERDLSCWRTTRNVDRQLWS